MIGCRQAFVRFADCNLSCDYCDTPFTPGPEYRFEEEPGSGTFRSAPNPARLDDVTRLLEGWERVHPGLHHSLSLTGGEPLLHAVQIADWLPSLAGLMPVFLETNGTMPDELSQVLPVVEWVSMDIKLQSVTGEPTPWALHAEFLEAAGDRLCQVKVIVGESTTVEELTTTAELMQQFAPEQPLILQPVTEGHAPKVKGPSLLAMQQRVSAVHRSTRVIPQVHPMLTIA